MRDGLQRTAIEDLVLDMSIGIRDWEREQTQRVAFDVAVYRAEFGHETDIADCYDYSALRRFLIAYREAPHVDLLETLLGEVLDYCFTDPSVVAAEAQLAKLDVFGGDGTPILSASVTRDQWLARRQTYTQ